MVATRGISGAWAAAALVAAGALAALGGGCSSSSGSEGGQTWGDAGLEAVQWGAEEEVTLFFPGHASWQWLTDTPGHEHPSRAHEDQQQYHAGAFATNKGLSCALCHRQGGLGSAPEVMGGRLVDLVDGDYVKAGALTVNASAAYDDSYFYLKVTYQSQRTVSPSITHQTFRFDGAGDWETQGSPRDFEAGRISDDDLAEGGRFDYEDRFAVMLNPTQNRIRASDENVGGFEEFGCFITCHSSMRNMPELPESADVEAHPYLGDAELGRSDIRHYLLGSRDAQDGVDGNWADIDPGYPQAAERADGRFVDLWQARMARSVPIGHASNDYVMEYRHSGVGGVNPWFDSRPDRGLEGAWLYDPRVTGYWAIPEAEADSWRRMGRGPLITEDVAPGYARNGVRFTDLFEEVESAWVLKESVQVKGGPLVAAGTPMREVFEEGDLLPRRVLRQPTGARGDLTTFVRWDAGAYTVIFRRALDTGNESDHPIDLVNGHVIAFAVFDDNVSNRSHHISFPFKVGRQGSGADLIARRQ